MAKLYLGDTPEEKKKNTVRAIIFVLAVIIAVVFFTRAVLSIGYREPGYYTLEAEHDEDAPFYASDIAAAEYFEGSSSQIRLANKTSNGVYSNALSWAYKLFDPSVEYKGLVNIASINNSITSWPVKSITAEGTSRNYYVSGEITLSPQLYDALTDAYGKTLQKKGYNMFAGALLAEWKSILILEDAESFDPLINAAEAERLRALAEASADLSAFSIEPVPGTANCIEVKVAKDYMDLLSRMECGNAVMDTGLLKESYMMDYVFGRMKEEGSDRLVVQTSFGLSAAMDAENWTASYFGREKQSDEDPNLYYYTVKDGSGKVHSRSLFFDEFTGEFYETALYTNVRKEGLDFVEPVWINLQLASAKSEEELKAMAAELGKAAGAEIEYKLY